MMITGGDGQLGFELQRTVLEGYTLDIWDEPQVEKIVQDQGIDTGAHFAAEAAGMKAWYPDAVKAMAGGAG